MARFIVRRIAGLVVSLVAVSVVIFGSIHVAPGDPLDTFFEGARPSDEAILRVSEQYHLNESVPVQYALWAGGALTWDFGESIGFRQDVAALIASHLGTSVLLVGYAMALVTVLGIPMGVTAARHPGSVDRGLLMFTGFLTAVPAYVAAVVLISFLSVQLGWFPTFGRGDGFLDQLHHLTLPAIALAAAHLGMVARVTRMAVLDELGRPHVDVARSRGVGEGTLVRRHVLRNALMPVATILATRLGSLIAGTTIVETAFGVNGLGSLLVRSVSTRDFPVVQAVTLLIVLVFSVALLAVDIVQKKTDPRSGGFIPEVGA